MYGQHTLVVSLLLLIFSRAPFGVLVYAWLAGQATSLEDWTVYTVIMLVGQLGYSIFRGLSQDSAK